ncbi:MAG: DUF2199 domain-containing protein [Pseudolysinimonas sp.]
MSTQTWTCKLCGETHEGLAFVFGPDAPDVWMAASDDQRTAGGLSPDQCFITVDGQQQNFMRGHIVIPVTDGSEVDDTATFVWSVWVSLSDESMALTEQHWTDPDRASLAPMFAWLGTSLPYDESTLGLPTNLHTGELGQVPSIEVDPGSPHQLARDQTDGITMHRVAEINQQLMG